MTSVVRGCIVHLGAAVQARAGLAGQGALPWTPKTLSE